MTDSDKVKTKMAALLRQPQERLTDDTLLTDLVTDSFLLVQMVIELQEAFGIRLGQDDLKDVKTVRHLTRLFEVKSAS